MSPSAEKNLLRSLLAPLHLGDNTNTTRQALVLLLLIRTSVTALGAIGLVVYQSYTAETVPLEPMVLLFTGIFISVILGSWRLAAARVISRTELLFHLLTDVFFLVLVLLTVGGASNPLISYLLVLMAVGATFLSQFHANLFAVGSITIYTVFILTDLRTDHGSSSAMLDFQLHLIGMWAIFVVSAILISIFVSRMAKTIRERELTLAQSRENEMRNEQLVAIGTLAAGTAHALGTPLSTMSVLLSELDSSELQELNPEELKDDISILRQQVTRCKNSLNQLTRFYNKENDNTSGIMSLMDFVANLEDYLINIHPSENVKFRINASSRDSVITYDPNINYAVINIIENGIKAASSQTNVVFSVLDESSPMLEISIQDDGPGVPSEVMENMGEPFISTRENSMGLGIYLANATIQKAGGSIEMFNLKTGGAVTLIRLPAWKHGLHREREPGYAG